MATSNNQPKGNAMKTYSAPTLNTITITENDKQRWNELQEERPSENYYAINHYALDCIIIDKIEALGYQMPLDGPEGDNIASELFDTIESMLSNY